MPSVLESNEDEPTGADEHFEPVWRRLDDILTMAQPFDVVGFGQVRCLPLPTLRTPTQDSCASWIYGHSRVQSSRELSATHTVRQRATNVV